MTDLDVAVVGGSFEGGVRILMPGREAQHCPYVKFRGVCGAHGYFASASFVDDEAYGGGKTPREALKSLAASLRQLADAVEATAKESK